MRRVLFMSVVAVLLALPAHLTAQTADYPLAEDVASPEAIVVAGYEAIGREPGENYDWERFRSLFLPGGGVMVPNTEQTGGEFSVFTVDEFIAWVDGWTAESTPIGSPDDRGFYEEQIHAVTNRYGDVAQVMSTYTTRLADSEEILGRGVNGFTLVFDGDRWWIASVAWDEENGAGPIPEKYLP